MQNKATKTAGKSVIPGKVVQVRAEFVNHFPDESQLRTSSFFTVLTNPKAIVKNGHEILVVDLLASDSRVVSQVPMEVLEALV